MTLEAKANAVHLISLQRIHITVVITDTELQRESLMKPSDSSIQASVLFRGRSCPGIEWAARSTQRTRDAEDLRAVQALIGSWKGSSGSVWCSVLTCRAASTVDMKLHFSALHAAPCLFGSACLALVGCCNPWPSFGAEVVWSSRRLMTSVDES
jgi:hypothetical protein